MTDYLKPDIHAALIRQLAFISEQTRIPESYLRFMAAKDFCTQQELDWIRNAKETLRQRGGGMLLHGKQDHPISKKMLGIGATLVRNFIDARVYPVASLIDIARNFNEELPTCSVLIIPDLFISDFDLPKKDLHILYNLLIERFGKDKMVICYVDNLELLEQTYGSTIAQFITSHYDKFAVDCTVN